MLFFKANNNQLIRRALNGSTAAWELLVRRYEKKIYNYGLRMTGQSSDAMDIMQDVFLTVYQRLSCYRGDGDFEHWLMVIAHNRLIDFLRKRRTLSYRETPETPELLVDEGCPPGELQGFQRNQILIQQLRQLPLEQRSILELKFYQQWTFDEIAIQIGLPLSTIKSRYYAALKKLKVIMEESDNAL